LKKLKEAKLAHLNWYWRESNMRPRGGAHSQIPSQYDMANTSGLYINSIRQILWYTQ